MIRTDFDFSTYLNEHFTQIFQLLLNHDKNSEKGLQKIKTKSIKIKHKESLLTFFVIR